MAPHQEVQQYHWGRARLGGPVQNGWLLAGEGGHRLGEGPGGRGLRARRCAPSISITTSCYPLPSICVRDPVSDWFESLAQCLHWNVRKRQAHFTAEEAEEEEED